MPLMETVFADLTSFTVQMNRTLPTGDSSLSAAAEGGINQLNIFIIVGLALVITVLARYFSHRGGRKR